MNVLLTGATSFIGEHLARDLVKRGHDVTGTYRTENDSVSRLALLLGNQQHGRLRLVKVDLSQEECWRLFPKSADVVVHIAAVSKTEDSGTQDLLDCNINGLCNVIKYSMSAGIRQFVYTSSLSVHGNIEEAEVDEHTPIREPGLYGATKYLGERLLFDAGLSTVALRLPGVLGLRAHRAWIPTLLSKAVSGEEIRIFNPDARFNNAVHVSDLQTFLGQMIDTGWSGFHAFPVAASGYLSIREVADLVVSETHSRSKISEFHSDRPSFTIRSGYAEKQFLYRPQTIRSMIEQYINESCLERHGALIRGN